MTMWSALSVPVCDGSPRQPPMDDPHGDTTSSKQNQSNIPQLLNNEKLQLISGEELGDRKPMQLLRRMQQLLGDKLDTSADSNSFFRELFQQYLPPNVRMVLSSADTTMDLNKLADMADKVIEVSTTTVASVSVPESQQQTSN